MSGPALGKLAPSGLDRLVLPHLGAARPEVLLGPRPGSDAAIVRVSAGRVLAMTTDPLSLLPGLSPERSAWLACHLVASDLWTSGIPPEYAAVTLNLPAALPDDVLEPYLRAMGESWRDLGIAVVTGHTGRYDGLAGTIVGAATLVGVGDEGRWIGPPFVRPKDRVLITRDCAVEATAIAAQLFPRRLAQTLDEAALESARALIDKVSVVGDCRVALRVGVRDRGVAALHDATEGGVLGGLLELARAAGCDLRIERARIPLSTEARGACAMLGIDPYWALSEGTLILVVRAAFAGAVVTALAEEGTRAFDVGEIVPGHGTLWLTEPDGAVVTVTEPVPDPYWDAYARAVRDGWT